MKEKDNFIVKALKQMEYDFITGNLSFQESIDKFFETFDEYIFEEIKKNMKNYK